MTFLSANYIVGLAEKNSRQNICFMIFLAKFCRLSVYVFHDFCWGKASSVLYLDGCFQK